MKTPTVRVSLAPGDRAILRRFRENGRYHTHSEVVGAALQRLEETDWDPNAYPPGSLTSLYSPAQNLEELQLNKVSSLKVDGRLFAVFSGRGVFLGLYNPEGDEGT